MVMHPTDYITTIDAIWMEGNQRVGTSSPADDCHRRESADVTPRMHPHFPQSIPVIFYRSKALYRILLYVGYPLAVDDHTEEYRRASPVSKMSSFPLEGNTGRVLLQQNPQDNGCVMSLTYSSKYVLDADYFVSNITFGEAPENQRVAPWSLGVTFSSGAQVFGLTAYEDKDKPIVFNNTYPSQTVFKASQWPAGPYNSFQFVEQHQPQSGRLFPEPISRVVFNEMYCETNPSTGNCEFGNNTYCEESWRYCCKTNDPCLKSNETAVAWERGENWEYPKVWQDAQDAQDANETNPDLCKEALPESSNTGWIVGVACGVTALVLLVLGIWYWRRRRWLYLKSLEDIEEEEEVPEDVHDLPWYVSIHKRLGSTVPRKRAEKDTDSDDWVLASFDKSSLATLSSEDRKILNGVRDIQVAGYSGVESLDGEHFKLMRSPSWSWSSTTESTQSDSPAKSASTLSRSSSWDGKMTIEVDEDVIDAARRLAMMRARASGVASGGSNGGMGSRDSGMASTGRSSNKSNNFMPATGILDGVDLHIPSKVLESSLGKCLGEGSFGAVYKAKYKGRDVAIKKVSVGRSMTRDQLLVEIGLAARFDSDRLVKIHGASLDNREFCYIVMELLRGGDLDARIHGKKLRKMTYIEVLQASQDIAEGLSFLHPLVIHRDLKPGNILIDGHGRMKIADFGLSRERDIGESYFRQTEAGGGTMMYMAPEEWGFNENTRGISEKADIYALALIMNEMLTRRRPWRVPPGGYAFACIAMELQEGNRPWMDPETPIEMQNLMKRMWNEDPHRRPSASDVVKILERMIEQELGRLGVPVERKRSIGKSIDSEL